MSDTITISPKLSLKLLQESDANDLFALVDRNREHLRQWLPWVDATQSSQDTLTFIRHTISQVSNDYGPSYAIIYENSFVGCIGYHAVDTYNKIASIGYWLSEDMQGHGIMTAACKTLVHHAFESLHANRVEIRAAYLNHKSCSIPKRLKFTQEAILRERENLNGTYFDQVIFALLKSEYRDGAMANTNGD